MLKKGKLNSIPINLPHHFKCVANCTYVMKKWSHATGLIKIHYMSKSALINTTYYFAEFENSTFTNFNAAFPKYGKPGSSANFMFTEHNWKMHFWLIWLAVCFAQKYDQN